MTIQPLTTASSTPLLTKLLQRLGEPVGRYAQLDRYYAGKQPLAFLSPEAKAALASIFRRGWRWRAAVAWWACIDRFDALRVLSRPVSPGWAGFPRASGSFVIGDPGGLRLPEGSAQVLPGGRDLGGPSPGGVDA